MSLSRDLIHAGDAALFAKEGLEFSCDDWQSTFLRSTKDSLLLLHRQSGKTTITSILALHTAKFKPGSLTLLLAPSQRQSKGQFVKIRNFMKDLEPIEELETDNTMSCKLQNGSRIVSLPGDDPAKLRGWSAPDLIIEDEACWVKDEVFEVCQPMLLVSKGRHVLMTTPSSGSRGHFAQMWNSGGDDWQRIKLAVTDNPRIDRDQLEKLRRQTSEYRWRAEYLVEWMSSSSQLFSEELIESAFVPGVKPIFSCEQIAAIMA